MLVFGTTWNAYLVKDFCIRPASFAVWKKIGTLYCAAKDSSAAATALDTGPNSAETLSLTIMLRAFCDPVAGSVLSSALVTLIVLPSTPPLALRSAAASWIPCRPLLPNSAIGPDNDVDSPIVTLLPPGEELPDAELHAVAAVSVAMTLMAMMLCRIEIPLLSVGGPDSSGVET